MRLIALALVAGLLALIIDLAVAQLGLRFTGVPKGFPPFTFLPILSGALGGAILASVVYALLRAFTQQPDRNFFLVVAVMLALSFLLPLRLSFTKSRRFAGVTPAAQAVLLLMHAVVASSSVVVLTGRASG